MPPEGVRLTRAHEGVLLGSLGSTVITGLLWLLFHYFVHVQGEFGEVAHPLEPSWLALHSATGMIALVVLGSIIRGHIVNGWKSRRNRASGGLLVVVAAAVVATGWALYYSGNDVLRPFLSATHWVVGICGALVLPVHSTLGRRR